MYFRNDNMYDQLRKCDGNYVVWTEWNYELSKKKIYFFVSSEAIISF